MRGSGYLRRLGVMQSCFFFLAMTGLAHAGSISGSVVSAGVPFGGGQAVSRSSTAPSWHGRLAQPMAPILTGLAAGSYKVCFQSQFLVSECYNNKANIDVADLVSVSQSGDTGGVDADLVSLGSISGRVTAAGVPVEGEYVWVRHADAEESGIFSSSTDAEGKYTVRGLPAGLYKVSFTTNWRNSGLDEWFRGKSSFAFADPVAVALQSDTGGIDADLRLPGRIVGRVTYRGLPAENVWVSVYLLGGDRLGFFILKQALTDTSGRYVLGGLDSGLYPVKFGNTQWYSYKPDATSADIIALTAPGEVMSTVSSRPLEHLRDGDSGGLPLDATHRSQVSVQDLAGKVLADERARGVT